MKSTKRERTLSTLFMNSSTDFINTAQDYQHLLKNYHQFFMDIGYLLELEWPSTRDLECALAEAMQRSNARGFTAPFKPSGELI